MPLSFDTQMLRIGELFSDSVNYVMPSFQGAFSRDENTAGQLFDDTAILRSAAGSGSL
jgi:hypothetical protein